MAAYVQSLNAFLELLKLFNAPTSLTEFIDAKLETAKQIDYFKIIYDIFSKGLIAAFDNKAKDDPTDNDANKSSKLKELDIAEPWDHDFIPEIKPYDWSNNLVAPTFLGGGSYMNAMDYHHNGEFI